MRLQTLQYIVYPVFGALTHTVSYVLLCVREQRQYRRHVERLVIVRALMARRVSREKREARAKEVERRFR